jgi:hypothetical protein
LWEPLNKSTYSSSVEHIKRWIGWRAAFVFLWLVVGAVASCFWVMRPHHIVVHTLALLLSQHWSSHHYNFFIGVNSQALLINKIITAIDWTFVCFGPQFIRNVLSCPSAVFSLVQVKGHGSCEPELLALVCIPVRGYGIHDKDILLPLCKWVQPILTMNQNFKKKTEIWYLIIQLKSCSGIFRQGFLFNLEGG